MKLFALSLIVLSITNLVYGQSAQELADEAYENASLAWASASTLQAQANTLSGDLCQLTADTLAKYDEWKELCNDGNDHPDWPGYIQQGETLSILGEEYRGDANDKTTSADGCISLGNVWYASGTTMAYVNAADNYDAARTHWAESQPLYSDAIYNLDYATYVLGRVKEDAQRDIDDLGMMCP